MRMTCVVLALVFGVGCTSAMSQLQRARALKRGHVEVTAVAGVPLSSGTIRAVVDSAEAAQAARRRPDAVKEQLDGHVADLTGLAAAMVVAAPSLATDGSVRVGLGWGLEVSARVSGPRVQAGLKWQALDAGQVGVDLAVFGGYGGYLNPAPRVWDSIPEAAASLRITRFSRQEWLLALMVSRDAGAWFSLWGGVAASFGNVSLATEPLGELKAQGAGPLQLDHALAQLVGNIGFRVGVRPLYLVLEFTMGKLWFDPRFADAVHDLGGFIYSPSVGFQVSL